MPTFHLLNFGCRASQADGAAVKRQLLEAGLAETARADDCEIAVLNTCTVTSAADAEVRQIIRRIHRANPACRVLVTGCYAQRDSQEIAKLPGVEWVVGNSHKHLIAEVLGGAKDSGFRIQESGVVSQKQEARIKKQEENERGSGFGIRGPGNKNLPRGGRQETGEIHDSNSAELTVSPQHPEPRTPHLARDPEPRVPSRESRATVLVGEITEEFHFAPVFADDATRPTLKVQDGCDARCSFCIIPEVRGPSRSLAPDIVIAQVRELEQQGYKEIVLSGINLGSYGKDLGRRITFQGLVERILNETSIPRIRISSIEPMDVTPELIRLVAGEPRMARHFHVPLQSGCDRTLRAMNRRYWTSHYAERIWAIHEQIPYCGIGADVMAGFPGETEEDHQASLRFIESLPFTYAHVFPYSSRPGTPAAERAGHLNGRIIHERGREIREVVAAKRQAFMESQIGLELSAVTLAGEVSGARVALSSNYLKVLLPEADVAAGALVDVKIGGVQGGALYGYAGLSPAVGAPMEVNG